VKVLKKRILVISQYFYPEQFRINDICLELEKRGYEVTVITGIPNYPQGKFYKGYGFFKKRKGNFHGIEIKRIPIIPRRQNYVTLSLNYFSFIISGFFWHLFTNIKADYVFCFGTSPITQALPGIWFSKKKKIPCYLYLQDLWPQSVEYVTGITNNKILSIIGKLSDYVYKNCSNIFVPSKGFINALLERGIPRDKITYWPQYAEDLFKPLDKKIITGISQDFFNIIFTGNIGIAQGLEILPRAASLIKKKDDQAKIKFNIVGDGRAKPELIKAVRDLNVEEMFNFFDHRPVEKIPELLSACNIAFLSLKDDPIFRITIPAKLQTYLACGKPIVAAISGEAANIITESNAGLCSPPCDEETLANNILKLYRMDEKELAKFSENARRYYENNFEKNKLFDILEEYFNK